MRFHILAELVGFECHTFMCNRMYEQLEELDRTFPLADLHDLDETICPFICDRTWETKIELRDCLICQNIFEFCVRDTRIEVLFDDAHKIYHVERYDDPTVCKIVYEWHPETYSVLHWLKRPSLKFYTKMEDSIAC